MSKESNRNITRRNVLAGIGASGVGIALGTQGVAAGEQNDEDDNYPVPVAMDWQESFYRGGKWKYVESFPDSHNDAMQDDHIDYCDGGMMNDALVDVDDPLSSHLRTDNKYTDPGDPLIDFHGVKPGYGGEATLSYHLCGEPGELEFYAHDVDVDKKLAHMARARVWYDEYDGSNDNHVNYDDHDDNDDNDDHDDNDDNDGSPGDNVYQPYEPIIAQGSLKDVLYKLKDGIHVSGEPYVASPDDMEGIHYYGYPRKNTSGMKTPPAEKYEPGWITDYNVDRHVHGKKVKEMADLAEGVKLYIEGTGYVARDKHKPLPDLRITVEEVITDKKGKPVGFEWTSNLAICRIEIASGDHTKLNVFDRARSGTALAPLYDDHDDKHGRRRPMTGVRFGAVGDHDDDWCIENSSTGHIGFEWWLPKYAGLDEKTKFEANFDFNAVRCLTEPGCPDCEVPDPGEDDFDVTIESIDDSAFPTVEATARVDTAAGGEGVLEASDFQLCEETVGGLGDGYCGQEINDVAFGGEQEETLADIMLVMDTSGSMGGSKIENAKDGAITLFGGDTDTDNDANDGGFDPTVNVGLVEFNSSASLVSGLGTDQNQVEDDIDGLSAGGGTDVGSGISKAQLEFDSSGNNRDNAPDFMIVLGNGDTSGGEMPANDAKNSGTTIYGIAYGSGAAVSDFEDISGEVPNDPDYEDYTFDADEDDITDIFDEIGQQIFGTYTLEYETENFATDGNDRNVLVYVDDPDEGDADTTETYTAPSS